MPLGRNDDMRIRRQVTRFNIVAAIRPAIASGDREICGGVCLEYSLNERQRAMDDPFRGPDAQSQFLPSGGTTYARRYFQQFFFLYLACVSAFCQFPCELMLTYTMHSKAQIVFCFPMKRQQLNHQQLLNLPQLLK